MHLKLLVISGAFVRSQARSLLGGSYTMVKRFYFFVIISSIISCSGPVNFEKDLVGMWRSEDGALLTLNADSTFFIENLPAEVVALSNGHAAGHQQGKILLNYVGRWETSTWYGDERFSLRAERDSITSKPHENVGFMVFRSGLFQNGPPSSIQIYLDSDGVDVYEFTRSTSSN